VEWLRISIARKKGSNVMSKFLLSVALGLASLAGFASAEPLQSPLKWAAAQNDWGYFRAHSTRQDAFSDGANQVAMGRAQEYKVVYEPSRGKYCWAVYLR
jgi:hypothetical protein